MSDTLLRITGFVCVLGGLTLVYLGISATGRDLSDLVPIGLLATLLGAGCTLLNRWAVWLLSILCGVGGVALIVGTIRHVPFPFAMINLIVGGCLLVPMVACVRRRRG